MKKGVLRETDLALERRRAPHERGVLYREAVWEDIRFTALTVTEEARESGLPVGKTLSVSLSPSLLWEAGEKKQVLDALRLALQIFFPTLPERLLVAGLGNRRLTADSLGPVTADLVEVTAALPEAVSALFGLSPTTRVAVVLPDVFPKTGIESVRTVASAAKLHRADAVLTLDALAAKEKERLFRVIEITDTGTVPGGGVKQGSLSLTQKELGIPVVAIGIPTVVRMGEEHFLVSRHMEEELHTLAPLLAEAINLHFGGVSPLENQKITSLFGK